MTCFIRTRANIAFTNQAVGNSVADAPTGASTTAATVSGSFMVNIAGDQPKFCCGASPGGTFTIHRHSREESVSELEFTRVDDIEKGTITEDSLN